LLRLLVYVTARLKRHQPAVCWNLIPNTSPRYLREHFIFWRRLTGQRDHAVGRRPAAASGSGRRPAGSAGWASRGRLGFRKELAAISDTSERRQRFGEMVVVRSAPAACPADRSGSRHGLRLDVTLHIVPMYLLDISGRRFAAARLTRELR
jgi:hypothetical protein